MMTEFDNLKAIEEIRQLKSRYFRFVDTKDWAGLVSVFCKEAVFGSAEVRGNCEIVKLIRDATEGVKTVHHGHCQEVWIESLDRAAGTTAFEDLGFRGDTNDVVMHGYGRYDEQFSREDGEWRIQLTRISRISVISA